MDFDAGAEEFGANGIVDPYKFTDVGIKIGFGALNSLSIGKAGFENQVIKIYPVPSHDFLNISKANTVIGLIEVFDSVGKLLYAQNINSNKAKINISNFSSGVYVLKSEGSINRFVVN